MDIILYTDYSYHNNLVKEVSTIYDVNSDLFELSLGMFHANDSDFPAKELVDTFRSAEVKKILRHVFLHFADISNPSKPFYVCKKWAMLVIEEFFAQGDKEKQLNIPVQAMNDRDTVNIPQSQIGFIEFLVAPLYFTMARILPPLTIAAEQIIYNAEEWMKEWTEQHQPSETALRDMKARIRALGDRYEEGPKGS